MRTRNGTETHEENATSPQPRGHKRQSSNKGSSASEPEADSLSVMDLIKDQMSKDLNVPYHQIDAKKIKNWGEKGFEKVKADEWWSKPNEVERARFSTMHRGAALRKKL